MRTLIATTTSRLEVYILTVASHPHHIMIMSSSPTAPPRLNSESDQSMQDSTPRVKRSCDRRMKPNSKLSVFNPNQQLRGLPPVTEHMSCYAKHASSRFKPYQPGKHTPSALEHRFMTKNVLKRHDADLSLVDIQKVL